MLYSRIINKDSYQLIINIFSNKDDRENLLCRLKLKPHEQKMFTSDCLLIVTPPGSPMRRSLKADPSTDAVVASVISQGIALPSDEVVNS